jgi:hypothetical protein
VRGVALGRVRGMEKQERAWNVIRYRVDGDRVGWVSCDHGKLDLVYIRLTEQTVLRPITIRDQQLVVDVWYFFDIHGTENKVGGVCTFNGLRP